MYPKFSLPENRPEKRYAVQQDAVEPRNNRHEPT